MKIHGVIFFLVDVCGKNHLHPQNRHNLSSQDQIMYISLPINNICIPKIKFPANVFLKKIILKYVVFCNYGVIGSWVNGK